MVESSPGENPKGWWFSPVLGTYFLDVENDPEERHRGDLLTGYFNRSHFLEMREGLSFKRRFREWTLFLVRF